MSVSHHRKRTKHHHQQASGHPHKKTSPTAAIFMAVIGLVFGLSFGWFTTEQDVLWSIAGGIAGAMIGYLFGRGIDRSFKK